MKTVKRIISIVLSSVFCYFNIINVSFLQSSVICAQAAGDNITARADYLYSLQWTAQASIGGWGGNYYVGNSYHLPYGQPYDTNGYIYWNIAIDDFMDETQNANSLFYTKKSHSISPYYGIDCSAFASYCWDLPRRTTTHYWNDLDVTNLGKCNMDNIDKIQPGDALNDAGSHIIIITRINDDGTYEVTEETPPQLLRRNCSASRLISEFGNYTIYRYNKRESVSAPPNYNYFDFWGVENGITVSNTYKLWFKQVGLGNASNSDVNVFLDGKEFENCLGTIYQDDNGFYSIPIDTTKYSSGQHTIYAVFRNTSGTEKWVQRTVNFEQEDFFDFWGVDDNILVSDDFKMWFKQVGLGDSSNSDVNLYIDGKELSNYLTTMVQDDDGFFSYSLDTTMFSNGKHTVYSVFRNKSGKELWRERTIEIQNHNFFDFWGVDDEIVINDNFKFWFKQVGLGNESNSDVNIYIDGKESANHLITLKQDENGYFSYSLDTALYENGKHTIYAVFRNTAGKEVWRTRTVDIQNQKFFDFWGVDDALTINKEFKIWFKQIGYPRDDSTSLELYVDSIDSANFISTLYQDDNGYFSYPLNTFILPNGNHIFYAVLKTNQETVEAKRTINIENAIGDCNGDGVLNVSDVILLQKWLLAVPETHLECWQAADLCQDERLDVFDLCLIKRKLIND